MKKNIISSSIIASLTVLLLGCGHGFEGNYKAVTKSNSGYGMADQFMNGMMGDLQITIGDNYMDSRGQRQVYDEIFVDERNNKDYLILKLGNEETAMEVVDKNTLKQGAGMLTITYKRID